MSTSTEAPFSVTMDLVDPNGIKTLLTLRGQSNSPEEVNILLTDRDALVERLIANGWKASVPYSKFNNPPQQASSPQVNSQPAYAGNNCDCGVPRQEKSGFKNGKRWAGQFCANKKCGPVWDK